MKIGQKDQKKKLVHDKEEFIDPSFFHIQFSIGGKVFKKAVDGLLSFEVENLDELTDEDMAFEPYLEEDEEEEDY